MNLAAVVAARQAAQPRPSWSVIFAKAFSMVAARRPELRRAYLSFPKPHFYEHGGNVASIALERHLGDEEAVLFAHLKSPEAQSLAYLDALLRQHKEQPVESIASFRRILRLSRLPRIIRRLAWWFGLNVWGRKRARYMGTFGISTYSSLGASSLHPLTPLAFTLNYGVIDAHGTVDVRIIYDHRVLDGAQVARALHDIERVLNCEILSELRYMHAAAVA
jgi:hypothetical protein